MLRVRARAWRGALTGRLEMLTIKRVVGRCHLLRILGVYERCSRSWSIHRPRRRRGLHLCAEYLNRCLHAGLSARFRPLTCSPGAVRLRTVRVQLHQCKATTPFHEVFLNSQCFAKYKDSRVSKESFGPDNQYESLTTNNLWFHLALAGSTTGATMSSVLR